MTKKDDIKKFIEKYPELIVIDSTLEKYTFFIEEFAKSLYNFSEGKTAEEYLFDTGKKRKIWRSQASEHTVDSLEEVEKNKYRRQAQLVLKNIGELK